MKKTLLIVLAIALCAGMTAIAMAGVSGSPHDVRVWPGTGATHVCESCHTPHSGSGAYPLWNRDRTHEGTSFDMYASPTFDMQADTLLLGYQSRLCFACHDGAVAQIVNVPGYDLATDYEIEILDPTRVLDTNLTNDHPVGFNADLVLDTGGSGLSGLTYTNTVITGAVQAINFPVFPPRAADFGTFQCATCHTVHHTPDVAYTAGPPPASGQVYFLRVSNAGSAMCRECHPNYY